MGCAGPLLGNRGGRRACAAEDTQTAMDPLHRALVCFNQRRFQEAVDWATRALANNEYDEAAWVVKMRSLTEQVYVDEVENEDDGLAESLLDDLPLAALPRPGTSLSAPKTAPKGTPSQAVRGWGLRPRTNTGRPLSGFVRPGSKGGRPGTMDAALSAPRTAKTARPVTSSSGRHLRLGTASMLSGGDGAFINVSRLNLSKYATRPAIAKPLFEYLFYHENDVRNALQLASLATQAANFKDWFWKVQLGKCYYRLGMFRDAEKQFRSAATEEVSLEVTLLLGKVYTRLDQPLSAMEAFKKGLDTHPNDVRLLIGMARLHEMGVSNAELYCNIGLCCYYSQQWDLSVGCVEKALTLVDTETAADVWYNVGHIALGGGDVGLAYQCFRLALAMDSGHAEAVCNLGVVEMRKGRLSQARSLLQTAMLMGSYTFEPFYNYALLTYQLGELQASYGAVKRALEIFPEHADSGELRRRLDKLLTDV